MAVLFKVGICYESNNFYFCGLNLFWSLYILLTVHID